MGKAVGRGAKWEQEWNANYKNMGGAKNPDFAKMWHQMSERDLPPGLGQRHSDLSGRREGHCHARIEFARS